LVSIVRGSAVVINGVNVSGIGNGGGTEHRISFINSNRIQLFRRWWTIVVKSIWWIR
jgi:hypothetical protein